MLNISYFTCLEFIYQVTQKMSTYLDTQSVVLVQFIKVVGSFNETWEKLVKERSSLMTRLKKVVSNQKGQDLEMYLSKHVIHEPIRTEERE